MNFKPIDLDAFYWNYKMTSVITSIHFNFCNDLYISWIEYRTMSKGQTFDYLFNHLILTFPQWFMILLECFLFLCSLEFI